MDAQRRHGGSGTLGGLGSTATAINALGHVAGSSETQSGETHAFLWTPSTGMIDLGTLPESTSSRATALNDSDQVVGTSQDLPKKAMASWTPAGGMVDIGTLRGLAFSVPTAVNASGQVVGFSSPFQDGSSTNRIPMDIRRWYDGPGRPARFRRSAAYDVNDAGQVVGMSVGSTSGHAFSWTAVGGLIDLGIHGGFWHSSGLRVSESRPVRRSESDPLRGRFILRSSSSNQEEWLVGMWESRVLCEISKVLWKSFL